jgi:hypothetical protein
MLRRTIALALAGLALAAPPALASCHWNSQMKDATETASRSANGCTIKRGGKQGSLVVSCDGRHTATLVYAFPVSHSANVQGTPTSWVAWSRGATMRRGVRVARDSLRVTVTVTGGSTRLDTVSVGYYTH